MKFKIHNYFNFNFNSNMDLSTVTIAFFALQFRARGQNSKLL